MGPAPHLTQISPHRFRLCGLEAWDFFDRLNRLYLPAQLHHLLVQFRYHQGIFL